MIINFNLKLKNFLLNRIKLVFFKLIIKVFVKLYFLRNYSFIKFEKTFIFLSSMSDMSLMVYMLALVVMVVVNMVDTYVSLLVRESLLKRIEYNFIIFFKFEINFK